MRAPAAHSRAALDEIDPNAIYLLYLILPVTLKRASCLLIVSTTGCSASQASEDARAR